MIIINRNERNARVATVTEKYLENEIFFQVREKSGNFVYGQGNLERSGKVREFENKWLWQSENLFNIGERMYFLMR